MPCRVDSWMDEERVSRDEHNMLEASMCGILTAIEKCGYDNTPEGHIKAMFDQVDWAEAGVRRKELEAWWRTQSQGY